jgi:GNAT superfamily N-acetyltransferase
MTAKKLANPSNIVIRQLSASDIPIIIDAFQKMGGSKPSSLFEQYLAEQDANERLIWLAFVQAHFAGYITLKWQSSYQSFSDQNIPEIKDLNVLPCYRKLGIGSRLLQTAEQEAATKRDVVGLGTGLYGEPDGGYGAAQRLYVNRGYIPDGKGVTYNDMPTKFGLSYPIDDDLILWFIKKLR